MSWLLECVPDHCKTQEMCNEAVKKQIDRRLSHLGWYPSQYWDQCIPHDDKKEIEKLWNYE